MRFGRLLLVVGVLALTACDDASPFHTTTRAGVTRAVDSVAETLTQSRFTPEELSQRCAHLRFAARHAFLGFSTPVQVLYAAAEIGDAGSVGADCVSSIRSEPFPDAVAEIRLRIEDVRQRLAKAPRF